MKGMFKTVLKIILIMLLMRALQLPSPAYARKGSSEGLEAFLLNNSSFGGAEITQLVNMIEAAAGKGIPERMLSNKIREGVARGVSYEAMETVLGAHIETLHKASELIKILRLERSPKGVKEHYLQVLAELLTSGMPYELPGRIKQWSEGYLKGADILRLCTHVMGLVNRGVPYMYANEAVILLVKNKTAPDTMEKISELLIEGARARK